MSFALFAFFIVRSPTFGNRATATALAARSDQVGRETDSAAMKDAAIHGQESLHGGRSAIGEELRTEPSRPALEENLGLGELAEPEGAVGASKPAGLAAAKRRPGVGAGSDGVVDADHPGLKPAGQVACGT